MLPGDPAGKCTKEIDRWFDSTGFTGKPTIGLEQTFLYSAPEDIGGTMTKPSIGKKIAQTW